MPGNNDPSTTARMALQCLEDSERWFGDTANPRDLGLQALCLCGESGEVANIVKKIARGSLDIHDAKVRHDLAMELTDVYIYLLNLSAILGIDLERAYVQKRAFNDERFMAERKQRERKANGSAFQR